MREADPVRPHEIAARKREARTGSERIVKKSGGDLGARRPADDELQEVIARLLLLPYAPKFRTGQTSSGLAPAGSQMHPPIISDGRGVPRSLASGLARCFKKPVGKSRSVYGEPPRRRLAPKIRTTRTAKLNINSLPTLGELWPIATSFRGRWDDLFPSIRKDKKRVFSFPPPRQPATHIARRKRT